MALAVELQGLHRSSPSAATATSSAEHQVPADVPSSSAHPLAADPEQESLTEPVQPTELELQLAA